MKGFWGFHKSPGSSERDAAHDREAEDQGENQPKFKLQGSKGTNSTDDDPGLVPPWKLPSPGVSVTRVIPCAAGWWAAAWQSLGCMSWSSQGVTCRKGSFRAGIHNIDSLPISEDHAGTVVCSLNFYAKDMLRLW